MIINFNKLSLFSILFSVFLLSPASFARSGTIVAAKKCLSGGQYPEDCTNIKKPDNRSCEVSTRTSYSKNGWFKGTYSIPAFKIRNKAFRGFVNYYTYPADGIARSVGEWQGSTQTSLSTFDVTIEHLYIERPSRERGYYLDYHCKLN